MIWDFVGRQGRCPLDRLGSAAHEIFKIIESPLRSMMIFLVFSMVQMQFFQNVEASFRSRLTRFSNNHELAAVHKEASSAPKCSVPCQLESFWISFDKVLEMAEIPSFLHPFLRSKSGDMIDIGKCYGSCNSSYKHLYPNLVSVSIRTW